MRKPTFFGKFPKSEKFAESRILHSLKRSGGRLRTNLVPETKILGVLGAETTKIKTFGVKMILRRVFVPENCRKKKKYVRFCWRGHVFCYFCWFWPKSTSIRGRKVCLYRRSMFWPKMISPRKN